jgi:uncharacterized protein
MGKRLFLAAALAGLLIGCQGATKPVADNGSANAAAPVFSGRVDPAYPALTGRVVDGANLLSAAEEASLTGELAALERRTTNQLVVVTVPALGGRQSADYSRDLGNHWGIGQANRNNGILLVVAPNERQIRIEVGIGLTATLTNEAASQIIARDLLPQFRAGNWFAGIQTGSRAIIARLMPPASQGGGK